MCLDVVYNTEQTLDLLEFLERDEEIQGVLRVYKVVFEGHVSDEQDLQWLTPVFFVHLGGYKEALIDFCPCHRLENHGHPLYWAGFHNFLALCDAMSAAASREEYQIISCLVEKNWILATGEQNGRLIVVSSAIFAPVYPDNEAQIDQYLEWRRQNRDVRPNLTVGLRGFREKSC